MPLSRVLVLGSGGREHALALRLREDPAVGEVILAPGHAAAARSFRCLAIAERDFGRLADACGAERVDLVVVGPEAPLAEGVVDALEAAGVRAFGPTREAARLESSKWFAKQVMSGCGIPTARAERHESLASARGALARFAPPWVIKADGLAAGKGVCVTPDPGDAAAFLADCLEGGRFGESGRAVLIEEFLGGEEASVMAVCDGSRHVLLAPARDYKRARDGDEGPNTGGMGAFAPLVRASEGLERAVSARIVTPLLEEMARRGAPFRGLLYCGLMLGEGGPRVVEFNVRFGDPETQVVLPLTGGSPAMLLASAAAGALDESAVSRAAGAAVAVALVERGYPGPAEGGGPIRGLEEVEGVEGIQVVHAATKWESGEWHARTGRAAYVVARGGSVADARALAYRAVDRLAGEGWRCRRDIAAGAEEAVKVASDAPAPARKG